MKPKIRHARRLKRKEDRIKRNKNLKKLTVPSRRKFIKNGKQIIEKANYPFGRGSKPRYTIIQG